MIYGVCGRYLSSLSVWVVAALNPGIRAADHSNTTCRHLARRNLHMEHVVFYPALDGAPAFRRFVSLEEAVRFVEHLRNAEGVSEVSVHTLSAVPLAFRAYYKVEVPQEPAAAVAGVPAQGEPAAVEAIPVEPAPVDAAPVEAAPADPAYDEPAAAAEIEAEPAPVVPEPVRAEAVVVAPPASPNGKKSLGFFAQ
jgi:hypothetical protein